MKDTEKTARADDTKTNDTERYQMMVNDICEDHDCLTVKQRDTLGKLLYEYENTGSESYDAVVRFLLDTEEIDMATYFDLEDLT